ncbi:hypothetical protein FS749_015188, partial [Ceratobasidium sp. UAMH 11750]
LVDYPSAEVKWFASCEDGWRWIQGRQSPQAKLVTPPQQPLHSPRHDRIRANAPYAVPSSPSRSTRPFNREIVVQGLRRNRSNLSDLQIPGAFPKELDASPSKLADSDLEYDDSDDEFLNSYDQSLEDSYFLSESDIPPPRARTVNPRDEDNQSTSSCSDDLPRCDSLLADLTRKDASTPTPPSSSQFDSSQPVREPTLPFASPSKPDIPEYDSSQPSVADLSFTGSPNVGTAAPETSWDNTSHESPDPPPVEKIELSNEQNDVLRRVLAGESLFFTGSAEPENQYFYERLSKH